MGKYPKLVTRNLQGKKIFRVKYIRIIILKNGEIIEREMYSRWYNCKEEKNKDEANGMDYRMLEQIPCEFEVRQPNPNDNGECSENSVAKVWWDDEEKDVMHVCQKHLTQMLSAEGE